MALQVDNVLFLANHHKTKVENMGIRKIKGGFYYEFMMNSKRYYGSCKDCKNLEEAREFENTIKAKIKEMRTITNEQALLIQYRKELIGAKEIPLEAAFDAAMNKPTRRMIRTEHTKSVKRQIFFDFVAFMQTNFPKVKNIDEVLPMHAENYVAFLQENGRFIQKTKKYKRGDLEISYCRNPRQSAANINKRICECNWVFRRLAQEIGTSKSPFDSAYIERMKTEETRREAFTPDELRLIGDNFGKMPFVRPLFVIAAYTALREGDICTLRWREIDLVQGVIRRTMNKTLRRVEIPILPPLAAFLEEQKKETGEGEYVLPEHAKLYLSNNATAISKRIKRFLNMIGIENQVKPDGFNYYLSVKDLHSMRHTFCSLAEAAGIPHNIIQSIVGHTTAAQTAHYARHVSIDTKRTRLGVLAALLPITPACRELPNRSDNIRDRLKQAIDNLTSEEAEWVLAAIQSGVLGDLHKLS